MKKLFLGFAGAALLLAGQAIGRTTAVVVPAPPPAAPKAVAIGKAPHSGWVWTRGYYRWTGRRYAWVPGRWVMPPRTGAIWVGPRWRRTRGGWVFVNGSWR